MFESVEKFSVIKTLQAIDRANVVILVLDALAEISEQDAHIAGFILDRGRALVVAVNKWDDPGSYEREMIKRGVARKLNFLSFAKFHYISAREGRGIGQLMESVDRAYQAAMAKLSTPKLTRALIAAVTKQSPPRSGFSRPKLRYAHQGGSNPWWSFTEPRSSRCRQATGGTSRVIFEGCSASKARRCELNFAVGGTLMRARVSKERVATAVVRRQIRHWHLSGNHLE